MAVSPWKTYKSIKKAVWSGRSRRLAKIIDANAEKREQDGGREHDGKTPGGRTN
jgi:hypothetical protein